MDVTGLIGFRARLTSEAPGPRSKFGSDGPFAYVVVGGFLAESFHKVGSLVEGTTRPHLILLDAAGHLQQHRIDRVEIQVAVEADDAPGAAKSVTVVPVRQ